GMRPDAVIRDWVTVTRLSAAQVISLCFTVMVEPFGEQTAGIEFELLRTYPLSVAMAAAHPFARLKSIPLEKLATEPFIALRRKDYSEYYHFLDRIFAPIRPKPRIAVACDRARSLLTEGE